ncbi:IS5/IS1182 family transposase, partial [Sodalis-like symbiont of Bactericera trigonica]
MAKPKFKITKWPQYNKSLRQRGSLTVWLDETAAAACTDRAEPEGGSRPLHYTDVAITTVLMMKRVFNLSLR